VTSFEDVLLTRVPASEESIARGFLPGARVLREGLSEATSDVHSDVRVLAVSAMDRVEPSALARMPALVGVVTRSDGYDHLPDAWLVSRGLPGLSLHGYATDSVAHHAVSMILALLHRMPEGALRTREGSWKREDLAGRSLLDVTVGVLGVGRIGSRVARHVLALGGRVLGHDLRRDPTLSDAPGFRWAGSLDELLAGSDVLTVHVPLTATTRGMLGARELSKLPPGAALVNTARGALLDAPAVEAALRGGRLSGFAADVLSGEPDPPDLRRFADLPNVLLTPHLAAYDARTIAARYEHTAAACRALLGNDVATVARLAVCGARPRAVA